MKRLLYILLFSLLLLPSCKENIVSTDPTMRLSFSTETLRFDTVFTNIGTATRRVMVYNRNPNAVRIRRVWMESGQYFRINLNGENTIERMENIVLRGNDSMYVFVQAMIDPQASNSPVLIEDAIHFDINDQIQDLHLEAYGQDVRLIRTEGRHTIYESPTTFTAAKPYLIYDTLDILSGLTIKAGARLYFHQGASLCCYGRVLAQGTSDKPIIMMGDRLDQLFDSVPYAYASGGWDGVYLLHPVGKTAETHQFNYVDIRSGNVGLYCLSQSDDMPTIRMNNCRIHNQALYGLVLQDCNAEVCNTEISNTAAYSVYLSGGKHLFTFSTIASYFNSTDIRIQSTPREDVAAVYINNLSKLGAETEAHFRSCIIAGMRSNNVVVATPLPQYYAGSFEHCYLKADTLDIVHATGNIYWQKEDDEHLFRNTFYKYKEYQYYDFRLDSLSAARGIADTTLVTQYPTDRLGNPRPASAPDPGCYQFISHF